MIEQPERPITSQELEVVLMALRNAPLIPIVNNILSNAKSLKVVAYCECGCGSVDFASQSEGKRVDRIADGIAKTESGEDVGVMVWGNSAEITGLEVYYFGGNEGSAMPVPSSITAWNNGNAT